MLCNEIQEEGLTLVHEHRACNMVSKYNNNNNNNNNIIFHSHRISIYHKFIQLHSFP
jgi:hypothetical protein